MSDSSQPSKAPDSSRRKFLQLGGAVAAVVAGQALTQVANASTLNLEPPSPAPGPKPSGPIFNPATEAMPTRNLGKTGFKVGIFSLGGQGVLEREGQDAAAIPIIERALDLGVNYIDTSSIYGGPGRCSERYIGEVMKRRRHQVFLASKTRERSRDDSWRMIEKSLKLLNTDHLDLWQLHDLGTQPEIERIFAKGGAMEALLEAKEQKVVRYLGITGHHRPDCLMEAIRRYPFDAILMALNAADKHHYSFSQQLLPLAMEKQMGIIGMKVTGRSRILSSWTPPSLEAQKHMWEGVVQAKSPGTLSMREAMYYALTQPVSTVIVGIDNLDQLEENVKLAKAFTPLSEAQMAAIAQRTEPIAKQAMFYKFFNRA